LLMAAEIINGKYDLGMPLANTEGISSLRGAKIEIVFADSEGSDTVGTSAAEKLISQEGVVALIGSYQSAVTAAASQVAEKKGIPFLSDTSTAPSLTQRGYQWFFRTTPDDLTFIQDYFQFLGETQQENRTHFQKIGIVAENSIFGSEFADNVQRLAPEYGYQVVDTISYSSTDTNVDSEVQQLMLATPDIVLQASYTQDAILYMETYKKLGFRPAATLTDDAGFNDPQFISQLQGDSDFVFTRDLWSKDWASTSPLANSVNQLFRDRYDTDMTSDSTRAFTGLMVLADAIERAGSTSPSAVQRALLTTGLSSNEVIMPWDGVAFDPQTHQNTLASGLISQIIDQEYRTVWPQNLATADPVWPAPPWSSQN
jgi:branched-chain amino acid transport system substrate-binding protein